jgi:hypothetical protein
MQTKRNKAFEERIVPINYPLIYNVFKSPDSIEQSNAGEIVDALCVLHSFHDRLRFYKGGLDTLIEEFSTSNDISQIKKTITYLLYGKGDIIKRMSDCIYNDEFKLNAFGQSNVQELIGWINKENLPVINGRTTKVLRYFGFDVRQFTLPNKHATHISTIKPTLILNITLHILTLPYQIKSSSNVYLNRLRIMLARYFVMLFLA